MGKIDEKIIVIRLAKIKYLYKIGVEQSMQVETVAGFSLLSFHDCAEMFLLLIAEDHGAKNEVSTFMEYWNKYPELTLRESMNNLKERRRILKHKGIFPSKNDIEESRVTITQFLKENTFKFFGVNFDTISLADLIDNLNVKEYVLKTEAFLEQGDMFECLLNAKIGFEELLTTYESTKQQYYKSIFNVGEEIGTGFERIVPRKEINKARWFEQVTKTTNALRNILKISAFGIDYKKYALFNVITPGVRKIGGPADSTYKYEHDSKEYFESTRNITIQDCRFCVDFVIDSALKLQEFDFDINKYLKRNC